MAGVERVMELDCLQMNAKNSLIGCHSFGCFLFIVRPGHALFRLNLLFTFLFPGPLVGVLVPLLVVIVKLGVHLPTILRGFIFYIQISPIAVEFLPQNFRLRSDVVRTIFACILNPCIFLKFHRCPVLPAPWLSMCHMTSASMRG